jgi:hypothetical protein
MSRKGHAATPYTDLIIAEIHDAISNLGGSARPETPDETQRAIRDLGADIDLRSIVDSWQETLDDDQILDLLRNWNAGLPLIIPSIPRISAFKAVTEASSSLSARCICWVSVAGRTMPS